MSPTRIFYNLLGGIIINTIKQDLTYRLEVINKVIESPQYTNKQTVANLNICTRIISRLRIKFDRTLDTLNMQAPKTTTLANTRRC